MNSVKFSISLLFFWIKGTIEVDHKFVKTDLSNTILGFIPAGKDQQSIPLKNISGAMLSTSYNVKAIILGVLVAFMGFSMFADSIILGLIILVLGLSIAGGGIQTVLNIEKAGTPYLISVPFFEKSKMQEAVNHIQYALAEDTDKTDLNLFFDKKQDRKQHRNQGHHHQPQH